MEKIYEYYDILALDSNRPPPVFHSLQDKKNIFRTEKQQELFFVETLGIYRANIRGGDNGIEEQEVNGFETEEIQVLVI